MNDAYLNRQHRLLYSVRGPEWAFAIPQGDLDALEDVMRRCAQVWNGAGAVLIPVATNGRIPAVIELLLKTCKVDVCYLHPSLGEPAQRAVRKRVSDAMPLYDGFDDHEIHPLHLAPERDDLRPVLSVLIPRFEFPILRRVALATWGFIPDEELPYWRRRFEVGEVGGEAALRALVQGQAGPMFSSPLLLSTKYMRLIEQRNSQEWPYLFVFDKANFRELVDFWNFRSRSMTDASSAAVLGLPRQALPHTEHLSSIVRWGASPSWMKRSPDMLVATASRRVVDEVDAALSAIGFDRDDGTKLRTTFGSRTEPRERASYGYLRPTIGGRFDRGARDFTLVAFASGKSAYSLTAPEGFDVRNVRLAFRNLPLPFPVTPAVARQVHHHAFADGGVSILTDAIERWNFDVRLPSAWDALHAWAGDHGYAVRFSSAGRYANALLERIGGLDGLHVFADELRIRVLKLLTPESRLKLTQRLTAGVAERRAAGERELADELSKRIAGIGLFLEVEARASEDLGSELHVQRPRILEALAPLVEASLVQRGQTTTCPRCSYAAFIGLGELREEVACRACREQYVLPVAAGGGRREPAVSYRLDGLMARVMDQGLLPVILTLRRLMPPDEARDLYFAWPGLEFERGEEVMEVDLLTSDGENVVAAEVKSDAAGLDREQLDRLLELCDAVGAKPCIAALEGTFNAELAELTQRGGGRVLHGSGLLR
jgi:hypothetical protein